MAKQIATAYPAFVYADIITNTEYLKIWVVFNCGEGWVITDQVLDKGRICDEKIGFHRDRDMYGAITMNGISCAPTKY